MFHEKPRQEARNKHLTHYILNIRDMRYVINALWTCGIATRKPDGKVHISQVPVSANCRGPFVEKPLGKSSQSG